jgi:hypothetical protein
MRWGIVGSEAAKFTRATEAPARAAIRALLKPGDVVITGRCPRGGVDLWAAAIGRGLGLEVIEHAPKVERWATGYKPRNIKIAEDCDEAVCITVQEFPPSYIGNHAPFCYHCGTTDHVVSGGCWTVKYARFLGKPGRVIVIPRPS